MDNYSEKDQKLLLTLARNSIIIKDKSKVLHDNEIQNLNPALKENRGAFVTLHKNENLRGCIGYILPMFPLYQTIIENAYNAAYKDPRFPPVSKDEIKDLKIEISILTLPEQLQYIDGCDLLKKLKPNEDGVIIKKGFYSATFLPQVWEQLPQKEDFLSHLCMKAGLDRNEWKSNSLEVEIYKAIVFGE